MTKADASFNDKVKKITSQEIILFIFVSPLKWDFSGGSDCQFDSSNMGLGIQPLSASYLQFICLEVGF